MMTNYSGFYKGVLIMLMRSIKSNITESWDDSKDVHSSLKKAGSELDSLRKEDSSYDTASNLILTAEAYLSAVDSIKQIDDELKKADDMSDFMRDVSKINSMLSTVYPKILRYIDGSKPSGSIKESADISGLEDTSSEPELS